MIGSDMQGGNSRGNIRTHTVLWRTSKSNGDSHMQEAWSQCSRERDLWKLLRLLNSMSLLMEATGVSTSAVLARGTGYGGIVDTCSTIG